MQHILRSYLKRLTNLSGANRSLLLFRLSKEQDIDLHELDFLNGQASFEIVKQLVEGKKKIALCDTQDSRDSKVNEASRQLKKLDRREKFAFEEQGTKDLHLGWPIVRGKLGDGTNIRCPLLFFPVSIFIDNNRWFLSPREGEELSFNKNFLLAYSYFNKISIADDFIDTSFEDIEGDIQIFRTQLYQLLKDSPVEINFNQELFKNQLSYFRQYSKADFEEEQKNGELMLHPEAVLGLFSQTGSYLVPDYKELLESNSFEDLEQFFIDRSLNDATNEDGFKATTKVKEEQTFTPFAIDASQEAAIKSIKQGGSLVVQGPPGTGKSQLICNLISDYIARGKKVLLVCQKRAALDVVFERLKSHKLADFVALLHDFRNDRNLLYSQISHQIDRLDEYKQKNSSLDALYLERTFINTSRQIDQITEELEAFKTALFDDKECGLSVKELYLSSSPEDPSINFENEYKYFRADELFSFPVKIKNWTFYASRFQHASYSWWERKSFRNYGIAEYKTIQQLLDQISSYPAVLKEKFTQSSSTAFNTDECEWIVEQENNILNLLTLVENNQVYANFQLSQKKQLSARKLAEFEKTITSLLAKDKPEKTLSIESLQTFDLSLQKAEKAAQNPIQWLIWSLFSKDKKAVKNTALGNQLVWSKENLPQLRSKLDRRIKFEETKLAIVEVGFSHDIPNNFNTEDIQLWFQNWNLAIEARAIWKEFKLLKAFKPESIRFDQLSNSLKNILSIAREFDSLKIQWKNYFTDEQISQLLHNPPYALELKKSLESDFDQLVEFDRLNEELSSIEKQVMDKLFDAVEEKTSEQLTALFLNSMSLAWIAHIESKYPTLRITTSGRIQQLEEQLQFAIQEKLRISQDIVLLRSRERTYKFTDYNRLNNMVTYRDLKHQVTKKKKIWPVRKLLSSFHDELFELIPCWMASPETVSAIFPMQELFDLVIFDEASQCFAEKGIPAMYRGKQVVVTGDDKQLSPNDLYQARWEDEQDETPELELDSLLALAKQYLMEVQLRGHYRSRSLELIGFSNRHFYGNTLELLPDIEDLNQKEPAIHYIKTDGTWINQSNQAEAEKVAELIYSLKSKHPEDSIGVVSFNIRQQMLIQDVVEEYFIQKQALLPESLFIKNIENVQGDERDHIIFSIAYAPDAKGKISMNFGSLNAEKGENRLNVAVTRARKKIYVISCIMPNQFNVENTKHDGPKLLKKYLEYAWEVSNSKFETSSLLKETKLYGRQLKDKICKLNQAQNTQVKIKEDLPFADLTLHEKGVYKSLLLTDDDLYFTNLSAKESHAYLPLIMANKNWPNKRVYSRDYWKNRNQFEEFSTKS